MSHVLQIENFVVLDQFHVANVTTIVCLCFSKVEIVLIDRPIFLDDRFH